MKKQKMFLEFSLLIQFVSAWEEVLKFEKEKNNLRYFNFSESIK